MDNPLNLVYSDPDYVKKRIQIKRARENFLEFIKYTKPDYHINWHHKLICDDLQDFMSNPDRDRLMIFVGPRTGKQIADSVPVLTTDGWTTHGELKVGDEVFHPSGKPVSVIGVSGKTTATVGMEFSTGEKIKCHENHEWNFHHASYGNVRTFESKYFFETTKFGKNRCIWSKKTSSNGERSAIYTFQRGGALEYTKKDLKVDPYFLGLWLGDGTHNEPRITHHPNDMESINECVARGYKISRSWTHDETGVVTTSFAYNGLRKIINKHYNLEKNKHIPEIYLRGSIEQRIDLLSGLIDSDGCLDSIGRYGFSNTNKKIIDGVVDIVRSLGWYACLVREEPKTSTSGIVGRKPVYIVKFVTNRKLNTQLPRKQEGTIRTKLKRYALTGVRKLEKSETEQGNCIQVDSEDGLYLVGKTLIPTHNSEIVSRRLPAYLFGLDPDTAIIAASYGADLAQSMNRDLQRVIDNDRYRELFPGTQLSGKNVAKSAMGNSIRTSDKFEIVGHEGKYKSAGVGGALTGSGGDLCFVQGTMVTTNNGKVTIEELVATPHKYLVLSYNHEKEVLQYKRITNTLKHRTTKDLVEIQTVSGRRIVSTFDHPIYTQERGYREANLLSKGTGIFKANIKEFQKLHDVFCKNGSEKALQTMLGKNKGYKYSVKLHTLWCGVQEVKIRLGEIFKEGSQRYILFVKMFNKTPHYEKHTNKKLCCVWKKWCEKGDSKNLFKRMFNKNKISTEKIKTNNVSDVSEEASTTIPSDKILLNGVQEQTPCHSNDRREKSLVRRWFYKLLPTPVLQAKALHKTARWWEMRFVHGNGKASRTPHRSEQTEFQFGKSNNTMPVTPHNSSQIEEESISSIKRYSVGEVTVYDIEVEGNHNFFADEILVHNCIIDDPVKDMKEAMSSTTQKVTWDWYTSVAATRLSKNGKVIVMLTRWSENDLAGKLLERAKQDPDADQWEVLCFPMEFEEDHKHVHPEDPRKEGDLLWPEWFPENKMIKTKATVGTKVYSSLYQQRPSPAGGSIFKRAWFNYYKEQPREFHHKMLSVDCAFKKSETTDYVAMHVYGMVGTKKYLIWRVKERLDFPETLAEIVAIHQRFPDIRYTLVEDKANGPAVISTLQKKIRGLIPFNPNGDSKEGRAASVAPQIEAGDVWLPDPNYPKNRDIMPWVMPGVLDMVEEVIAMPNGRNDDDCDAMVQMLIKEEKTSSWLSELVEDERPNMTPQEVVNAELAKQMNWDLGDIESQSEDYEMLMNGIVSD
jgi:predicted phage terminase large subunit-like protein